MRANVSVEDILGMNGAGSGAAVGVSPCCAHCSIATQLNHRQWMMTPLQSAIVTGLPLALPARVLDLLPLIYGRSYCVDHQFDPRHIVVHIIRYGNFPIIALPQKKATGKGLTDYHDLTF
jgi:hypothetical protein